ncbi:MAG: hypothetical protein E6J85_09260 [Deltaproteobacteria bacterium]|nr:MAG: hypothetical protein E6J85_09260 [Deltaproteobacteria bacterium]
MPEHGRVVREEEERIVRAPGEAFPGLGDPAQDPASAGRQQGRAAGRIVGHVHPGESQVAALLGDAAHDRGDAADADLPLGEEAEAQIGHAALMVRYAQRSESAYLPARNLRECKSRYAATKRSFAIRLAFQLSQGIMQA